MMTRADAALLNPLINQNCRAETLECVIGALQEVAEVAIDPGDMPRDGLLNLLNMVVRVNHAAVAALSYEKHDMKASVHKAGLAIVTR